MQKKNQGFTLIELMIVVAIVAILAAVAIPAYQDYLVRSKVSEIAAAGGACKTSVSEYYAFAGSFPNTTSSGCSNTATQYVSKLAVDSTSGVITVTGQNISPASGNITLTPTEVSNEITVWTCGGSIAAKYRPASCRG